MKFLVEKFDGFDATSCKPTAALRWFGGTLQQKVEITEFRGGVPVLVRSEWADVPTVDPGSATSTIGGDHG